MFGCVDVTQRTEDVSRILVDNRTKVSIVVRKFA